MLYNLFENRDFVSVFAVALLAEGVDRNMKVSGRIVNHQVSPSSRRAWIEMVKAVPRKALMEVALLAEGVDRNGKGCAQKSIDGSRPPRGGRG